jgi:hypothetical protein
MSTLRLPRTLRGWFDVSQNLALYAPLGLALAASGYSLPRICGMAAVLSLATELLQFLIPGRYPAARDVVVNTAGALIGYGIWWSAEDRVAAILRRVERGFVAARAPGPRHASMLSFGWAVGVAGTLMATAALLLPTAPTTGLWVASPYFDSAPGPLRFGSNGRPGGYFAGLIDEVRIFDRARPLEQIREDMLRPAAAHLPSDESLVAAYGFDSIARDVARDDTGHGHDGIVRGATWTDHGRFGGALSFDGASSEVVVPHTTSLDMHDGMTLEAWVRPSADATTEPAIISRAGNLYYLDESSTQGRYHAAAGGRFGRIPEYVILVEPIAPNTWTHLAATYDGQALRLYVNGSLAATQLNWSPHRPDRVVLNGVELTEGAVADSNAIRTSLLGHVSLDAVVTCGNRSENPAPVFLLVGLHDTHVLALDAAGEDLVVRPWTWARQLGLASPPSRVPDVFSVCTPGRSIDLTLAGGLQNPAVTRDGQALRAATPGLGSGWAFVLHADLLPVGLQVVATCAWLALMGGPLGFWARRTALSALGIVLVAGACLATPYLLHVRSLSVHELLAVLGGAAVGVVCRLCTRDSTSGLSA